MKTRAADMDPGKQFLAAVATAMIQRAGECNPQEISNTVWAFAKLRASFVQKSYSEHSNLQLISLSPSDLEHIQ